MIAKEQGRVYKVEKNRKNRLTNLLCCAIICKLSTSDLLA